MRSVKITLESRELRIPISVPRKKSYFELPLRNIGLRPIKSSTTSFLSAFKFLSDRARPCSSSIPFFFLFSFHRPPFDRSKHRTQVSLTWLNYLAKYRCLQSCTCRRAARILPDNIDRHGPGTAGEQEFLILSSCRNSARPPPRLDLAHVSSPPPPSPEESTLFISPGDFYRVPPADPPVYAQQRAQVSKVFARAATVTRQGATAEPDFSCLANLRHPVRT